MGKGTRKPSGRPFPGFKGEGQRDDFKLKGEFDMLWTIAAVLVVLWAAGMITSFTLGGLLHALLVIAAIIIVIRLVTGRRV
jgi:hypothetical protein